MKLVKRSTVINGLHGWKGCWKLNVRYCDKYMMRLDMTFTLYVDNIYYYFEDIEEPHYHLIINTNACNLRNRKWVPNNILEEEDHYIVIPLEKNT